mgnify:CR=1 FL=1
MEIHLVPTPRKVLYIWTATWYNWFQALVKKMVDLLTLVLCVTMPLGFSGLVWFVNRFLKPAPDYMTLDTITWDPQQEMWILEDRVEIKDLKVI